MTQKLKLSVLCPAMADFNLAMLRAITASPTKEQQEERVAKAKEALDKLVGEWVDVNN